MNRLWKNFQTFEMIKNSEQTKKNTTNSCIISGEKRKTSCNLVTQNTTDIRDFLLFSLY